MPYNPNTHTSDVPFVFVYKCQLPTLRQAEYNATYYPDNGLNLDLFKEMLANDLMIIRSADGAYDFLDNDALEFLLEHFDELVAENQRKIVIDDLFTTENLLSEELKTYLAIKTGVSPHYNITRNRYHHYRKFDPSEEADFI